jgi:hypothetical protein
MDYAMAGPGPDSQLINDPLSSVMATYSAVICHGNLFRHLQPSLSPLLGVMDLVSWFPQAV